MEGTAPALTTSSSTVSSPDASNCSGSSAMGASLNSCSSSHPGGREREKSSALASSLGSSPAFHHMKNCEGDNEQGSSPHIYLIILREQFCLQTRQQWHSRPAVDQSLKNKTQCDIEQTGNPGISSRGMP